MSFDKLFKAFVLNCDKDKNKFKKFNHLWKKNKYIKNIERFSCFYAGHYSNNLWCSMYHKQLIQESCDINKIEVAIALSHYLMWNVFIHETDKPYALICEDDAEMKVGFTDKVVKLVQDRKLQNSNIIYLWNGYWNTSRKRSGKGYHTVDGMVVDRNSSFFIPGTVSYIVTRDYAKYLIQNFFPIYSAVDVYMGSLYHHGLQVSLRMHYGENKWHHGFRTKQKWSALVNTELEETSQDLTLPSITKLCENYKGNTSKEEKKIIQKLGSLIHMSSKF